MLKNKFQIPTCISQIVIDVLNMREVFVVNHKPAKTHVFFLSNYPPAPRNMLLNLMTHTRFSKYETYPSENDFDSLKQ